MNTFWVLIVCICANVAARKNSESGESSISKSDSSRKPKSPTPGTKCFPTDVVFKYRNTKCTCDEDKKAKTKDFFFFKVPFFRWNCELKQKTSTTSTTTTEIPTTTMGDIFNKGIFDQSPLGPSPALVPSKPRFPIRKNSKKQRNDSDE